MEVSLVLSTQKRTKTCNVWGPSSTFRVCDEKCLAVLAPKLEKNIKLNSWVLLQMIIVHLAQQFKVLVDFKIQFRVHKRFSSVFTKASSCSMSRSHPHIFFREIGLKVFPLTNSFSVGNNFQLQAVYSVRCRRSCSDVSGLCQLYAN